MTPARARGKRASKTTVSGTGTGGQSIGVEPDEWRALIGILRARFGTDFSQYRTSTLRRRLQKRMSSTGQKTLARYVDVLRRDPQEQAALKATFLIKVSSFFRDPEAWNRLKEATLPALVRRLEDKDEVRIWVAGCATGEEAYSLALLLAQATKETSRGTLRIFATDIDDAALAMARQGLYHRSQLAHVPAGLLRAFFREEGAMLRVGKEVRKMIVFGRHDLTKDPPIANLDLLSCRNVLIYLAPAQKKAVLGQFAYAVRPGGFLLLGKSEQVQVEDDGFRAVSRQSRLYLKSSEQYVPDGVGAQAVPGPMGSESAGPERRRALRQRRRGKQLQEVVQSPLLQSTHIILIALDKERRVTLWNKAAEASFGVGASKARGQLFHEVADGLSIDKLGKAIKRCISQGATVELRAIPFEKPRGTEFLDLDVTPLHHKIEGGPGVLLSGTVGTARHLAENKQNDLLTHLRKSVQDEGRANENLQAVNEELETLNEELQSSMEEQQTLNEELRSRNEDLGTANDELQSRNEALETANEELQSTNEELSTLNEEVRVRIEDFERIHSSLRGLLDSIRDMVIVCDQDDRITVWSRAAREAFRLSDRQALGHDLFELVPELDVPAIQQAIRSALLHQQPALIDNLSVHRGSTRLRVSIVCVTRDERARGYTLFATNVTAASDSPEYAKEFVKHFREVAELGSGPMLLVDREGLIRHANSVAQKYFGDRLRRNGDAGFGRVQDIVRGALPGAMMGNLASNRMTASGVGRLAFNTERGVRHAHVIVLPVDTGNLGLRSVALDEKPGGRRAR